MHSCPGPSILVCFSWQVKYNSRSPHVLQNEPNNQSELEFIISLSLTKLGRQSSWIQTQFRRVAATPAEFDPCSSELFPVCTTDSVTLILSTASSGYPSILQSQLFPHQPTPFPFPPSAAAVVRRGNLWHASDCIHELAACPPREA